ncbi:DUF6483 family protein [Paenibacillus sp. UNC499MF]|uniref:DUF6483 family protein n=1 Tax=Paenibacillus sp. UNC499MF TaxID=1502751 RepID=UPI0008A0143B|nr:DUF6483 family protein [Paenibacillus sp. UNC499MF]SEF64112.1 hypothetical protein SAMN02799616_00731 [Paenibacillus sp. UNC499MF]
MFERKDYLLTMITQMTEAIATRILKLRKEKKHAEALAALGELYGRMQLPPSKLLGSVPEEDALRMLMTGASLSGEKLLAAAKLLREEADIYEEMSGEREAYQRRVNALYFYLMAAELGAESDDISLHAEIAYLNHRLKAYRQPPHVLFKLMEYCSAAGSYDEAENLLYELKDRGAPEDADLPGWGAAFYRRLLDCSDEALQEGKLPRDEVEAGLREWEASWPRLSAGGTGTAAGSAESIG